MGKKRSRTKYISKGQRPNVTRFTLNSIVVDEGQKMMNKLNAWIKGQKGTITVPNPNTTEKDKPFIKVSFERYFGGTYKDIKSAFNRKEKGENTL